MANPVLFDATAFRAQVPQYADPTAYPDAVLQQYWSNGTNFITDTYGAYPGIWPTEDKLRFALNLMTAHLLFISGLLQQGITPGVETASSVGQVSISLQPPPLKTQWQFWLQTTPYGMELLALLQTRSVGGWYAGGDYSLLAIRG